ncbi:MAG: response regulator [Flavisolibacter sp.]|jgi:signal transduction histidine kinase|nr:response regulator [Flavisolibacter sp.]
MEILKPENIANKSPVKILVVDDREDNLFSIETILEQDDYHIVKASSGMAALKVLLKQDDFTLILMDVQMPDMNGFETANLIYQREKLKHIPIIFITAHNYNDEHVFEGYRVGAIDYIYKPINPELLRFKVGVFAEMYQKNHQLLVQERKLKQMNANLEKEIEDRRLSEEKVKLLNEQLLENNTNLKTTIEELDRFAYVASHDLQEPLRKILVFSDKLLTSHGQHVSEDMQRYMEKIVKASERMQKLINDLLSFCRQADDKNSFEEVDLTDLLSDVLSDMEVEIERHSAIIKLEALPKVWAVKSQMQQLFQNLVSNGIKFRKIEDVPIISIYKQADSAGITNKAFHRIVVEDNGIGFDDKYADEIFVVFKRLHSYHEYEGTGVGLSICKKIIDSHKGRIAVESKLDEGSKFIIDLPVIKKAAAFLDVEMDKISLEE